VYRYCSVLMPVMLRYALTSTGTVGCSCCMFARKHDSILLIVLSKNFVPRIYCFKCSSNKWKITNYVIFLRVLRYSVFPVPTYEDAMVHIALSGISLSPPTGQLGPRTV
jgi:hypothetical protein